MRGVGTVLVAIAGVACSGSAAAQDWRNLYDMAVIAQREFDYELAESKLLLALEMAEAADAGPEEIGRVRDRLGLVYFNTGRDELAEEVLSESLDFKTQHLGDSHPAVAETLLALSEVEFAKSRYEEAGRLLERAVEIRRAEDPADGPALAEALVRLGYYHESRGSLTAAEASFREALRSLSRRSDPLRERADALIGLREILRRQGRGEEADALDAPIREVIGNLPPEDGTPPR